MAIREILVDRLQVTVVRVPERAVLSPAPLVMAAGAFRSRGFYPVRLLLLAGPLLDEQIEFAFDPLDSVYV